MLRTCCPHFTIRLCATDFKPSKSQRSVLNKVGSSDQYNTNFNNPFTQFHKFIWYGDGDGTPGFGPSSDTTKATQRNLAKQKGRDNKSFNLQAVVKSCETEPMSLTTPASPAHRFQSYLEPADVSVEKYRLYKKYQMAVHGDSESKASKSGFTRFLCESPLVASSSQQPKLGSFHHIYRLDGNLIAIGVLDILPHAVSSVYLIWDPDWSGLSLGKVSISSISCCAEVRVHSV